MSVSVPLTWGCFEVAGTVDALGPGVTTAREGGRVAVLLSAPGGYAEYITADAAQLIPIPDGVTIPDAAGTARRSADRAAGVPGSAAFI